MKKIEPIKIDEGIRKMCNSDSVMLADKINEIIESLEETTNLVGK